ncbi:MAG: DUF1259 domain-containing protein [Nitrospirae bacterium]|nr:DUF1259 domain-containing protein [Candidatus Manganitrophaceae bacterium]
MASAIKVNRQKIAFLLIFIPLIGMSVVHAEQTPPAPLDQKKIEAIFDRSGQMNQEVLKIGFPRTDLQVTLDGIPLQPALALTSWAAFKPVGVEAIALGDLALKEEEVKGVESKLKERGFEITAFHNHLVGEKPKVMYLHFLGRGKAEQLATNLKEVLQLTSTPLKPPPPTDKGSAAPVSEEVKKLDATLGREGKVKGTVIQYGFPRKEAIRVKGVEIPPFMGLATAIHFQLGKEKAATTGDFVLIEKEVSPVTQALREGGIEVTALHNHLLGEEPRLFFMHFWAVGSSTALAEGLKKALAQMSPQG